MHTETYAKLKKDETIHYVSVHPQVDGNFTVERGTLHPDNTKTGVQNTYDQDARYVEFSIKLAVADGYKKM